MRNIGGLDRHAADHPDHQQDQSCGISACRNHPPKNSGLGSPYRRYLVSAGSIG